MSQYTTGEIAKLAGVTVRTVQYYDSRGILMPSDFSEGGRRLYNEKDVERLRIICFLRDLGIQINDIGEILAADNAKNVISVLLEQQLSVVQEEIAEREKQKQAMEIIQKEMNNYNNFSVENLTDIANQVKNRKRLQQVRTLVFAIGIPAELLETAMFIVGLIKGVWWPFLIGVVIMVCASVFLVYYYNDKIAYICPECHRIFRPTKMEFLLSNHTPTTRKLKCRECGHNGFCIETYQPMKGEN